MSFTGSDRKRFSCKETFPFGYQHLVHESRHKKKLSNLFLEIGLVNTGDMLKLIQHLGVNLPASLVCDRSRSESCYFIAYLVSIVLLKPKSKVSWTTNLIQQEKAV